MKRRDLILGAGVAGIAATSKLKAQTKKTFKFLKFILRRKIIY